MPMHITVGDVAHKELLRFLNSMAQDDACGSIVAMKRTECRLEAETLIPDDVFSWADVPAVLAEIRCELLIIDGGNAHGDSWKAIYHPLTRSLTFLSETPEPGTSA